MRFLHLADLHIGIRVNGFSMLEDQTFFMDRLFRCLDRDPVDAVVLAGDIYDKADPSAEAVDLFDALLSGLADRVAHVLVIPGNHDSPERIAYAGKLLEKQGVHIAPVYQGQIREITLHDQYGPVHFFLLPFLKPSSVRRFFPEETIEDYADALSCVFAHLSLNTEERNILVSHQFVSGALRSDSEQISIGGLDAIPRSVFSAFDYVALGHIHRPQTMGEEKLRYAGSPLKYSLSEVDQEKAILFVTLGEKGELSFTRETLPKLRDMRVIQGSFKELMHPDEEAPRDDYLQVILKEDHEIPEVLSRLRTLYPNIMRLDYENRWKQREETEQIPQLDLLPPLEIFSNFFQMQTGKPLTEEQEEFVSREMEEVQNETH